MRPGPWIAIVLALLATESAAAPDARRILFLRSFGPNFQAEEKFAGYLRTALAEQSPTPVDRYEVSIEIARFPDGDRDEAISHYLKSLFPNEPPDLIITVVSPAARFVQRNRGTLFPNTPVIYAGLDARAMKPEALTTRDATVTVHTDLNQLVQNVLQVLPDTTTLAIVSGDAPIEEFWVGEMLRTLGPFQARVRPMLLNKLPFPVILKRIAALPPHTAIFSSELVVDGAGVSYRQEDVLPRLHAAANAPIFGGYDYQLGSGIVGGPLMPVHALARTTAEVAIQILSGASPADFRLSPQTLGPPEFDWRELRRWGVRDADLPAGSTIRFRQPSLWEQYRWYLIGAAALFLLQAIFIFVLLVHRRRLKGAHDDLRTSEESMSLAARAARMRFWVWNVPKDEVKVSASDWSSGNWNSTTPVPLDSFMSIIHPEDRSSVLAAIERALRGDGDYQSEYRALTPDSAIRWITSRGRVEFDSAHRPSRLRAVSIDFTERRIAEAEARQLSGRLITAQEDERTRLAHVLHDDVTQRLALLAIETGQQERRLGETPAAAALRAVRVELVQLSEDVHDLSYALHPAILEDLGLVEALKAECARLETVEGIAVQLEIPADVADPDSTVALCLYRIAQEALRNVARHAKASAVTVALRVDGGNLILTVRDNGMGFDMARKPDHPSLGLAGMRQRLALVGGDLSIESSPGAGVAIVARTPARKEANLDAPAHLVG